MKIKTIDRNYFFYAIYLIIITLTFLFLDFLAFDYSQKQVRNKFMTKKMELLDNSTHSYDDFIHNKLPELSYYNGYLNQENINPFIDSVFTAFKFVDKIVFYDAVISPKTAENERRIPIGNYRFYPQQVYEFHKKGKILQVNTIPYNQEVSSDFNLMVLKFKYFIEHFDVHNSVANQDYTNYFFNNYNNKITYMSIPRLGDLIIYKNMIEEKSIVMIDSALQQDLITIYVNPKGLPIRNIYPELYQHIQILPSVNDPLYSIDSVYTTLNMQGGFSGFKLSLASSKSNINRQAWIYFIPLFVVLLILYFALLFIAILIFRNIQKNVKMYKLQYDFINNLTHEFKTPVSVIKIAGNNMKKAVTLSDKERLHYAKILDEEADKLNNLMSKILSFTQIENKAIQINHEDILIDEFIVNTIDNFLMRYSAFNITYEIKNIEVFNSDPILLGTLFDNIIENAYKYSPQDRKKLHILAKIVKGRIVFTFKDEGIGISKTDMDNIFKKFYRVESRYNQNGSVGLGLAFCKEVATLLGGDISVKSKENLGSEFTINLPYENNL